jgi:hypothetical protein
MARRVCCGLLWSEQQLEHGERLNELASAWVALWNYTVDPSSMGKDKLIEILSMRVAVFFPDDNRLIESYRVHVGGADFSIYVKPAEPNG